MPFKISHGQSYYMIFNEKRARFPKKETGVKSKKTIINKGCILWFVHLKNQNYRDKNVFFIPKSRRLLRYKQCIVVAER